MQQEQQQTLFRTQCNADVAAAIRDLRTLRGLTVEQAADLMGITPARLASIERGNLPHNIHNLARLVEALRARLAIIPLEGHHLPATLPHCEIIELEED